MAPVNETAGRPKQDDHRRSVLRTDRQNVPQGASPYDEQRSRYKSPTTTPRRKAKAQQKHRNMPTEQQKVTRNQKSSKDREGKCASKSQTGQDRNSVNKKQPSQENNTNFKRAPTDRADSAASVKSTSTQSRTRSVSRPSSDGRSVSRQSSDGRSASRQTSYTSISSHTKSTSSTDDADERQKKRQEKREVRRLSKVVERKLTDYINDEKREQSFNIAGVYTTTRKMLVYDVEYQLKQAEKDRKEARKKTKENNKDEKKNEKSINPQRADNSRQTVLPSEVERLSSTASEIFDSLPVVELSTIHRYRPHSSGVACTPDNGAVHNYSRHVGAALHSKQYVDYYIKEGLHSGNPEGSERLQKLPKKKEEEEEEDGTEDEQKAIKHTTKTKKQKEKKAKEQNSKARQDQEKGRKGNNGHSSREPHRSTSSNEDGEESSDTEGPFDDSFDDNDDDSVYSNAESISERESDATTPRGQKTYSTKVRPNSPPASPVHSETTPKSENMERASNYSYSNDFELEQSQENLQGTHREGGPSQDTERAEVASNGQTGQSTAERRESAESSKQRLHRRESTQSKTSISSYATKNGRSCRDGKDSDTVSVHTYMSTEHAVDTKQLRRNSYQDEERAGSEMEY